MLVLTFLQDFTGCYGTLFECGSRHEYRPWPHEWQGMTERDRVSRGRFVECHGHGEFDVFKAGETVFVTPNEKGNRPA